MKKLLFGSAILAALIVIAALLAWWNLPAIGSYAIGRVAGGKVEIKKVDISYKDGFVSADLGDISVAGKVKGSAKSWKLVLDLKKGLHFKHVAISGFNLEIADLKGRKEEYYIVPTDLLEVRDGIVTVAGESFTVRELVAEHLKKGKPFKFRADVQNDEIFGRVRADGDGVLKGRNSTLKGKAEVARMDMGRWTHHMAGIVDGQGSFTYGKGKYSIDGSFRVEGYQLKISELRKQRFDDILKGRVTVAGSGDTLDIQARDVIFKGTPFEVDVKIEKDDVSEVRLSSGMLNIEHIREYVNLEDIAKGASQVWEYVKDGRVELKKLAYSRKGPFSSELRVADIRTEYEDMIVSNIEGNLRFDEKKMDASGFRGEFKHSVFKDVAGTVTFSDKRVTAKGSYTVDLRDIASRLHLDDTTLKGGLAEGALTFERKPKGDLDWSGSGSLKDAEIVWKGLPLSADGAYSFTKDAVVFDPLHVRGGETDMALKGTWSKKSIGLSMNGRLAIDHVKQVLPVPVKAGGTAAVSMRIDSEGENLKTSGSVDLKDASYEIKDVMKKGRGIPNPVSFDISKGDKGVAIRNLKYNLESIDLGLSGDIGNDRKMNLDAAMKVDGFEKVAGLFAVTDVKVKGSAEARLSLKGFDLNSRKIPFMKGYISIDDGVVRLPWASRPFTEIKLRADFRGDTFDVNIDSFRCGKSVLRQGRLHAEGLESPRFDLLLDMDTFSLDDFEGESEFKMGSLHRNAVLADANGRISLKAGKVMLKGITGEDLSAAATLAGRKLTVSEFRVGVLGGKADLRGSVDFSGPPPRFQASGKISGITGDSIVKAFDPKSQILDGTGLVKGTISSSGEKPADWLANMDGEVAVYSRNGVIRRWSLLSKVFGILNVYDLLRGRVDLRADGLAYTKMSASFHIKNGIFRTDDLLIDSPSMLITGAGDFNFSKNTVVGNVTVSPLVGIDTVIEKVPIVRSILGRKKGGGFLYSSYEISGTLGDPEVKLSFVDTVGGKSLNLIKNILTLPVEVF